MMETNKLYNEDCLETMAKMPNDFIDLTVTSPPYDNLRKYNGYVFDFKSIAKELFRVTKSGGVVVWIVGDATIDGSETGTSFKQALYFKELGFNLHDTMIYLTEKLPLNHNRYEQSFEYMFILAKNTPKVFNPLRVETIHKNEFKRYNYNEKNIRASAKQNSASRYRNETGNVKENKIKYNAWYFGSGFNKTTKENYAYEHPATFPEKLAEDHILSWSNKNDLVYDCFMGSGTTAKMAILNERQWLGSEISKEYCQIANKRIDNAEKLAEQNLFKNLSN